MQRFHYVDNTYDTSAALRFSHVFQEEKLVHNEAVTGVFHIRSQPLHDLPLRFARVLAACRLQVFVRLLKLLFSQRLNALPVDKSDSYP
jgi:hypothetical protein